MSNADANRADRGIGVLIALIAVAALPFDSRWFDFELARRGAVLLLGAGLAATIPRWWPARLPGGALPWGVFCGWLLVRCVASTNEVEGLLRALYLCALFVVIAFGARFTPHTVARAALPVAAIVGSYGILQFAGLQWPEGYALKQAVSSLGNRNVASEFVALGAAAGLTTLASRGLRPITVLLLVIAASYLGINGSRSGILAFGLAGVASLALARGTRPRVGIAVALVALAASSFASFSDANKPIAASPTAKSTSLESPSTIAVRQEIWAGAVNMVADAPVFGHGTAQFRYEYPRYRTAEEIDLSSFGRRFATFVDTAHNDHIEVLVEGGAIALALWILAWATMLKGSLRRREGWLLAMPLLVFLVLALVRAPLANGPAALLTFLYAGALASRDSAASPARPRWWPYGLALAFATPGILILVAQQSTAAFLRTPRADADTRSSHIERAIDCHPSESRYRSMRLRHIATTQPDAVEAFRAAGNDAARIAATDPNNPTALFLIAEMAHRAGEGANVERLLGRILTIDPLHLDATQLLATRLCLAGDVARGIATLYSNRHPRLREATAKDLTDLYEAVRGRHPKAANLLLREAGFIRALDSLLADPLATEAIDASKIPSRIPDDRFRVLYAYQLLKHGKGDAAEALAPERLDINRSARRMLEPLLEELRALPRWRQAIGD